MSNQHGCSDHLREPPPEPAREVEDRRTVTAEELELNPGMGCSICVGALKVGDAVVDLHSHNLLHRAAEDNPEFIDLALQAHRDGGTVVFLAHEACAQSGELPV